MTSPNDTVNGSYNFLHFSPNSQKQEIDRLHHQSNILLNIEKNIWHNSGLKDGMQVVDLGCGTGTISCAIAQSFPNAHIQGIDPSHHLLNTARQLQKQQQITNLQFLQGNTNILPVPNDSIDFIYARLLLQHLSEPIKALREIFRVLKPGGKVCLVDVADSWFALYPQPPVFKALREYICAIQTRQGGDSQVGYKLGSYLSKAGFSDIVTKVEVVESDRAGGIKQFLSLFSFGSPYYSLAADLETLAISARKETAKLADNPYSWGAFGLFVATGDKFKHRGL